MAHSETFKSSCPGHCDDDRWTRYIPNSVETSMPFQINFPSSFIDTNNARIVEMENISRVGKILACFSSLCYTCGTHSGFCFKY